MAISYDYLPNDNNLKLIQDDKMFRINTDTMVLGEFIKVYRNDTVIDIGTNQGALLLYASKFNPKKMIGVDINPLAIEYAKKNMEINNITNCELINEDVLNYNGEECDVVICNPPYFKTELDNKSNNEYKNLAKHENILNIKNLCACLKRNCKNNGTLYLLYLTSRLQEIVNELTINKFRIKEIKFVYDENKEYSNVCLIKAKKGGNFGLNCLKPRIIKR